MQDEQPPQDPPTDVVGPLVPTGDASPDLPPLTKDEIAAQHAAWWKERQERAQDLVSRSRRSWAAMQGWDEVKTNEDWDRIVDESAEDWASGKRLITMLGGERYVSPEQTALMYHLWHDFVGTYRPQGPAEYLAIAMALIAFHQFIRANEFVGNLTARLESAFFGIDPPQVSVMERDGRRGPTTQEAKVIGHDALQELGRDALPLLDRLNRMVIRNIKALRDLKASPLALTVQNYGQLNVGQMQTNSSHIAPADVANSPAPIESEAKPKRRKARS